MLPSCQVSVVQALLQAAGGEGKRVAGWRECDGSVGSRTRGSKTRTPYRLDSNTATLTPSAAEGRDGANAQLMPWKTSTELSGLPLLPIPPTAEHTKCAEMSMVNFALRPANKQQPRSVDFAHQSEVVMWTEAKLVHASGDGEKGSRTVEIRIQLRQTKPSATMVQGGRVDRPRSAIKGVDEAPDDRCRVESTYG